ncbi:unnamed protein product [Echinostoma caproni]|uniref:WDR13 n=1 Tax=Echinostoma caproni TaxID=27848 RepID=A0A183BEQ0_9TREM|nr:unnamed protein product [Echinostoma caproni]
MEAWLIKALRLAHSKKPADQERLRRFYREVCDNESVASRITLADALREPRDPTVNVDSVEVRLVVDPLELVFDCRCHSRPLPFIPEQNVLCLCSSGTITLNVYSLQNNKVGKQTCHQQRTLFYNLITNFLSTNHTNETLFFRVVKSSVVTNTFCIAGVWDQAGEYPVTTQSL